MKKIKNLFSRKKNEISLDEFMDRYMNDNEEIFDKSAWAQFMAKWIIAKDESSYAKAVGIMQKCIDRSPTCKNYVMLGMTYEAKEDYDNAIKTILTCYEIDENDDELDDWLKGNNTLLGRIFDYAQNSKSASPKTVLLLWDIYIRSSTTNDRLCAGYFMRGLAKGMLLSDNTGAMNDAKKALEYDPKNKDVLEFMKAIQQHL